MGCRKSHVFHHRHLTSDPPLPSTDSSRPSRRHGVEAVQRLWENPPMSPVQSNHKKILIVEDEKDILQLVKLYLEKEGFRTVAAMTGTEGLRQVKAERPDLIILDLMLPEMDGLEVCKKLRLNQDTALLPILMLTAKAEESDTVIGLELGADDYITKPFSPKALVARVRAVLRRSDPARGGAETIRVKDLTLDLPRMRVTIGPRVVPLTPTEFQILAALAQQPG